MAAVGQRRLDRPRRGQGRIIAGVCGGIAQYYGWSPTLIRILFVIFGVVGAGELAYIILWIVMPKRQRW